MRVLAAGFALLLAATAAAQQLSGAGMQALMDEARVLQTTLEAVQARALQDESLAGKAEALVREVESRMAELEPQTPARLARLEQLRRSVETAASAEDRSAYDAAIAEARQLQEQLDATRSRVLAEESFTLRTMAFQRELVDAMTVIEPEVPQMLRRLEEIVRALG